MSDFQTPLGKVRGLGSAQDGAHHWWVQRVTALANIPLTVFLIVSIVGNLGQDLAGWRAWLGQPVVAVLMILFIANMFYHMRLGLQILIEDYLRGAAKVAMMLFITFATIAFAALGIFAVVLVAVKGA